jgi:hypothetical protein
MAIKTFTISPKPEQNLDSIYAFGKGLMTRGIIAGVIKSDGKVELLMLPETAARYAKNDPSFVDDEKPVEGAIKAAGYAEEPVEAAVAKPIKATPASIPAKIAPAPVSPTPATVAPAPSVAKAA